MHIFFAAIVFFWALLAGVTFPLMEFQPEEEIVFLPSRDEKMIARLNASVQGAFEDENRVLDELSLPTNKTGSYEDILKELQQ